MAAPAEFTRRFNWFHPGEIVVVAFVPRGKWSEGQLRDQMHRAVRAQIPDRVQQDADSVRSFAFNAPSEDRSLVFSFHRLADLESRRPVKQAVTALHDALAGMGGDDIEVIGVMPHWHVRAHDSSSGPSPGTFPRPVYPDQVPAGWKYQFYQPVNPKLDLAASAAGVAPVRVAVLDTQPELQRARERAQGFMESANNSQLVETLDWLSEHALPGSEKYAQEFAALQPLRDAASSAAPDEPLPYPMPDHGVFIAGLIHGIAPTAPISLEAVLQESGLGDLSLLLLGLQNVLENKREDEPQIINLSLGFLPHPARLPAAWHGLVRSNDPDYQPVSDLYDAGSADIHAGDLRRTVDLLQSGLHELGRYLSLNNCLVIAAVGNDSLNLVESGQERLEPRLPARFETVLGVAATTSDPRVPAPYSNVGDERELGDHVATFGGGVTDGLQPEDGVIGIYAGDFPFDRPNETGWAFWSGTSFATAIVTGIAANYWALRLRDDPGIHASSILGELHAEASSFGPYVAALRTPSIEVLPRWRR